VPTYDVDIQEFADDNFGLVGVHSDSVYFVDHDRLRKYKNGHESIVASKGKDFVALTPIPFDTLVRLDLDHSTLHRLNKCRFLAQCGPVDVQEQSEVVTLSRAYIRGDTVIAIGSREKQPVLFVENINTSSLVKKQLTHDLSIYSSFDGERLYGFRWEPNKALLCFDLELNIAWKSDLSFRGTLWCKDDAPQFFQDLVIFNASVEPIPKDAFAITAFAKADGSVVWTRVFERQPRRTILVGDKLYLALDLNMVVLDASTGKTLIDEPTGFKRNEVFRNAQQITVFPAGESLLAFGQTDQSIRVFTQDGKRLVQEIKLPRPNSLRAFDPFQPDIPSTPLINHNNIYCKLHHYTGLGAIGILSPTPEGEEPKITIKPRLAYDFSEIPDAQGGHGYRLHYHHDNLDDLVSAARYELMEMCQYCGIDRSEHKHFDPRFNGRVTVAVDQAKLPNDAKDELEKMAQAVEKFLETFLVRVPFQPFKPKPGAAPAKKKGRKKAPSYPRNNFKIEIELV
jgi:hypothetical protein